MKSLAEKVSKQLAKLDEFAPIYLWALFEHEDAPDKWDIVLSSQGSDQNTASAIRKISQHLVPELDKIELAAVSRIVVIPSEAPSVMALASDAGFQGGIAEIWDSNFDGLQIRHAYLFRTQQPPRMRTAANPVGAPGGAA